MKDTFNVLIVDDDEDDLFLVKTAFERDSQRYRLEFASNGHDLLKIMARSQFLPDLILLDLNMPVMNGFEVLKHLKNSPLYQHIPVIVLTTSTNESDINRAYELGANTFITKPIYHQALTDLAGQIRLYWFSLAKFPTRRITV